MNHLHTIDLFLDYSQGRLSDSDRALVEAHLAACPSCQDSYAFLRKAFNEAAPATFLQPDPHLPTRIRAIATGITEGGARVWMPALRWSAISLGLSVAVVLGIALGSGLSRAAATTTTEDVVSYFATSITSADPGDQWSSAVGTNGEDMP